MKLWRLVAALAGISMAASAPADGAADGATKAAVCSACHGPNGNSTTPDWPNLAGQSERYVSQQLKFFKEGKRTNPVMAPMAAALSDQDIADLAAYYAAQKPTAALEADPSYWEAGQKLYRSGDSARNLPACIACHGPVGRGVSPAGYPALRGQHSVYTQKQLNDYAAGARPGANAEIMHTIAARMTADEIRNVSSYIQGMR